MTTALDPFQSALLIELREVVAEGGARATRSRRPPGRLFVAAAAVLVVATGAVTIPSLTRKDPAYAVIPGANGVVDVEVNRLQDSTGLERALAAAGVRADVTYLPEGRQCAGGRYTDATAPDPDAFSQFGFGGGGFRVQLDPGAIADDQTLVIAVSPVEPGGASGQIGIAEGPVSPCRAVRAPIGP